MQTEIKRLKAMAKQTFDGDAPSSWKSLKSCCAVYAGGVYCGVPGAYLGLDGAYRGVPGEYLGLDGPDVG